MGSERKTIVFPSMKATVYSACLKTVFKVQSFIVKGIFKVEQGSKDREREVETNTGKVVGNQ
jgi:hypothetical protein